jgi:hypothetical protein
MWIFEYLAPSIVSSRTWRGVLGSTLCDEVCQLDRSLQGKVSVPPLHLFVAIKVITWKCSLIAVLPLNVHDILFVDFFPSM